ncbi:hypothetical protein [Bacillus piscicola]|uniref:hypothetical protein n=1 Tax=Bacillus piscicola TaxID=1632684 RepID=UPI001F09718D|nr:hypothetical protein [Bacillus piscicola]
MSDKLDLFDYTFHVSKRDIQEALESTRTFYKKMGNPRRLGVEKTATKVNPFGQVEVVSIPHNIRSMLWRLRDEGMVEFDGEFFSLREEYRDYHTADEIDDSFKEACYTALENGAVFYDLLSLRTTFSISMHTDPKEEKSASDVLETRLNFIAKELGVNHFKKNPKAAGHKMNIFSRYSKKTREKVVDAIRQRTTPESVSHYLKTHGLCKGEFVYNTKAPWINHDKVSFLDIQTLTPTQAKCIWLAETRDEKVIEALLNYCGAMMAPKPDINCVIYDGEEKMYNKETDLKKTFEELTSFQEFIEQLEAMDEPQQLLEGVV